MGTVINNNGTSFLQDLQSVLNAGNTASDGFIVLSVTGVGEIILRYDNSGPFIQLNTFELLGITSLTVGSNGLIYVNSEISTSASRLSFERVTIDSNFVIPNYNAVTEGVQKREGGSLDLDTGNYNLPTTGGYYRGGNSTGGVLNKINLDGTTADGTTYYLCIQNCDALNPIQFDGATVFGNSIITVPALYTLLKTAVGWFISN